jgi:NAD(P)-dependent dehydrogenase (short-subunit alcohol dehydrogenase family)
VDLGIVGRLAVVTGASRGIGRAVAGALATEGAALVISARGAADLDTAVRELQTAGANVVGVAGDVCAPETTAAIVEAAAGAHNGIDILVNNAGGESGHQPIDQLSDDDWELAYRLNVVSAVRLTVAALPHMRAQRWGRVVNVASYTARVPEPFCGPYAAAKAALVNVTRNLSRAYGADGVCANCVLPGLTETEGVRTGFEEAAATTGRSHEELLARMLDRAPIDAGRLGTAAEVAAAVMFLCSERASWITGAALAVDGGTVRSAP